MSRFTTCGLITLLALAPAALAVDGTMLINQSTITNGLTGCPTGGHFPIIICQSGSYRLSGSLTVPDANTTAIQVGANDVAIDLNGFSISGPGTKGIGTGIEGFAANTSASNGTIRGMGSGGISLGTGSSAYRIRAIGNGGDGISANLDSLVTECVAVGNGGRGISAAGLLMNNISDSNSSDGIEGSGIIIGNTAQGNSANGINVEDAIISGNVLKFNGKAGILALCPANISGNESPKNNTGGGIVTAGTSCLLVNNVTN